MIKNLVPANIGQCFKDKEFKHNQVISQATNFRNQLKSLKNEIVDIQNMAEHYYDSQLRLHLFIKEAHAAIDGKEKRFKMQNRRQDRRREDLRIWEIENEAIQLEGHRVRLAGQLQNSRIRSRAQRFLPPQELQEAVMEESRIIDSIQLESMLIADETLRISRKRK